MLKIENFEVYGIPRSVYSARNAFNSWNKSDSDLSTDSLGNADLDLAIRLRNAGTDHRKFMRMIIVYLDITAPLYWWKEFDTYKVGTVANSCSTMHKIADKEFEDALLNHNYLEPVKQNPTHRPPSLFFVQYQNCRNIPAIY